MPATNIGKNKKLSGFPESLVSFYFSGPNVRK